MPLGQKTVQLFGNSRRKIRLSALPTHIGRNIPYDNQFAPVPDFQRGLTGLQFASAKIAPINFILHFRTFLL